MQRAKPWTVLILLSVAQFMVILDVTVVNVALPSIGRSLSFHPADLQWVVTAYVLFTGGLLLLGGRAADMLGRRRVFLTGLGIFTAASLASALAPSAGALVVSRGAQGLGAALLTPGALATITAAYAGAQRTTALTVWGAIGGGGAAVGQVLGGVLTTAFGWRSVFFINVPVGLLVAALVLRAVPADRPARADRRQLDTLGALTVVAGLVLLVYAVEGTGEHGWGSAHTLIALAAATALLVAFVAVELRVSQPLVPPSIWRTRSLVSGVALMFGATGLLVGTFFLNSLYLQRALGKSALETGLAFLPITVVLGIGSHLASRFIRQVGSRTLAVAGLALMAVGAILLSVAPEHARYLTELLPGFLVIGLGVGLAFPAASVTTMSDVDHAQAGLASGLMTTGHELGAALGVATLSAVATGTGGSFAAGYGNAFLIAAVLAVAFAVVALVTVPSVRPSGEARLAVH
jgi:EmrB/QacA subfamily drug resistance transporter